MNENHKNLWFGKDRIQAMPPAGCVHVGTDRDGSPVFVPALCHMQIQGASGKGKSVLMAYMLLQLIHLFRNQYILIIDLGGDLFLRNFCKGAAQAAGRMFREFVIGSPRGIRYYFDPVAVCTAGESVVSACQALLESLGLFYGSTYGKSFHGAVNSETLARPLERLMNAGRPVTLQSLTDEMLRGKQVRPRDVSEAALVLQNLSRVPELGTAEDPNRQLTFESGFENRTVDYMFLPTVRASSIPIAVATSAFNGAGGEAMRRRESGKDDVDGQLIFDEAAKMNGVSSLESKLALMRKWASIKLMHQFRSQWYEHGKYFPDSLRSNCPVRILFGGDTKEDFDDLQLSSDDVIDTFRSRSGATLDNLRITEQERLLPGLSGNDIRDVNRSGEAFFTGHARKDGGPLAFRICYPTTAKEHEILSKLPMDDAPESLKPVSTGPAPAFDHERQKQRHAAIESLIAKYAEAESFDVTGGDATTKTDS